MKLLLSLTVLLGFTIPTQSSFAAEAKKKAAAKAEKMAVAAPKVQLIDMSGDSGKDIVEIAVGSKDHSTLVTAVKAADLVDDLQGPGPYTVFAPTDAAFAKLPKETIPNLLKPENKKTLVSILEHHTTAPRFTPEILAQQTELGMVDGPKLQVENKNGQLFVDGNEIKVAILAKNGIVYIVDSVILAK